MIGEALLRTVGLTRLAPAAATMDLRRNCRRVIVILTYLALVRVSPCPLVDQYNVGKAIHEVTRTTHQRLTAIGVVSLLPYLRPLRLELLVLSFFCGAAGLETVRFTGVEGCVVAVSAGFAGMSAFVKRGNSVSDIAS